MITVRNITDGIVQALFDEFGEHYTFYTEDIEQNLTAPAFFVTCVEPKAEQVFGSRYRRENLFNIVYFPKDENSNSEIYDVQERLFGALEYINVDGDLVRGTGCEMRVIDGVLNVTINYDAFVYKKNERVIMGEFECRSSAKKMTLDFFISI